MFAAGLAAAGEVPLETTEDQWWDQQSYLDPDPSLDQQSQQQTGQKSQQQVGQQSNQRSAQSSDQRIMSQQNQSDQRLSQQSSQQSASPLALSDADSSGVDASSSTGGPHALAEQQQSSAGQSSQPPVSSSNSQAMVSRLNSISDDSSNQEVNAGFSQSSDASPKRTDEDIWLNGFRSRDSGDTAQEQPGSEQQSSVDASNLGNQVASVQAAQQPASRSNPASAADDVGPTNGTSYWQDQAVSVQAAEKLNTEDAQGRALAGQDAQGRALAGQDAQGRALAGQYESSQVPYQSELNDSEEAEPLEVEQMSFQERLQAGRECFR